MAQPSLDIKVDMKVWPENMQNPNSCDLDDLESLSGSSTEESSDEEHKDTTETDSDYTVNTVPLGTSSLACTDMSVVAKCLKELCEATNNTQRTHNVSIENSSNVHIGNVTNINGNIQIIQQVKRTKRRARKNNNSPAAGTAADQNDKNETVPKVVTGMEAEREERVRRDAFIERLKFRIPKELCAIIPRHTWLAQVPMEDCTYMPEPVEYVIISHTATESSEKQAVNIRIIRDIQCFHIESREWNDIAYNFLIGCDGNVYEGRGWGVVGAHTMGYNNVSLGITFIGCFMRTLPNNAALNACKNLLKRGVEEGHLAVDYKLICHCQCRSTESPGRKLYEEIQTWEHFYNMDEE